MLAAYCAAVLWITLLSRQPQSERFAMLIPFGSYPGAWQGYLANCAAGVRNGTITVMGKLRAFLYAYNWIILNVMLFVPLGFLAARSFTRISWIRVIFWGLGGSVLIELVQFAFKLGCMDVDDVIHNTLGMALGCLLSALIRGRKKNAPQGRQGMGREVK